MSRTIKEQLYCHNCDSYQTFEWDMELEGKQVFFCPNCNHDHYRVMTPSERHKIAIMPAITWASVMDSNSIPDTFSQIEIKFANVPSEQRWSRSPNQ